MVVQSSGVVMVMASADEARARSESVEANMAKRWCEVESARVENEGAGVAGEVGRMRLEVTQRTGGMPPLNRAGSGRRRGEGDAYDAPSAGTALPPFTRSSAGSSEAGQPVSVYYCTGKGDLKCACLRGSREVDGQVRPRSESEIDPTELALAGGLGPGRGGKHEGRNLNANTRSAHTSPSKGPHRTLDRPEILSA